MLNVIVQFALRFRGIVFALALAFLGYGIYSLTHATFSVFPEFAPPYINIQTEAPGLSPEQVELLVTQPIENEINGVTGVESMRSTSIQGLSVVNLIFRSNTDIYRDRQLVNERLSTIEGGLPQSVHPPTMTPLQSTTGQVLVIGLSSKQTSLMDVRTAADWTVKPRLLAVPGVAAVTVFGGAVRQIQVQFLPQKLVQYNLSLDQVVAAAQRSSAVLADASAALWKIPRCRAMRAAGAEFICRIQRTEILRAGRLRENSGQTYDYRDLVVPVKNRLPMKTSQWKQLRSYGYAALCAASFQASQVRPQFSNRAPVALGQKLADGQAYVTLVQLKHQANASENGRILISFEQNGMAGLPIYESTDEGGSWNIIAHAVDTTHTNHDRCNLHWQPNLTELPRGIGDLRAGTLLLSASTVCNDDRGRMADQHLQLYTSTDLGRSWQYRSTIDEGTADLPVWEPNLQILDDGKLVTYYSSERHKIDGYNQLLSHRVSIDAGKSWGAEVYDVALPGGVERPGMAVVDRVADGGYVYTYEDVEGPIPNQVYMKFSRDGLHWGSPTDRGTPIQTEGGEYPINCPVVRWLPLGGPKGVLIVSARAAAGGGDSSGRSLFWNMNSGEGPWWEAPAPVQKLMNGRSGWTQALMLKQDGSILHITSSASVDAINNPSRNQILFDTGRLDLNRYEAEDAARQGSALMRDPSMSNGAKVRLGANGIGRLTFRISVEKAGAYAIALHYSNIGFDSTPSLFANHKALTGSTSITKSDDRAVRFNDLGTRGNGDRIVLTAMATLKSGRNMIEVGGGSYALDVDYLEVTPK